MTYTIYNHRAVQERGTNFHTREKYGTDPTYVEAYIRTLGAVMVNIRCRGQNGSNKCFNLSKTIYDISFLKKLHNYTLLVCAFNIYYFNSTRSTTNCKYNIICIQYFYAASLSFGLISGASGPMIVSIIFPVTKYGSALELGRRSSKYPFPSASVSRPIRIDAPRLATPYEN